MSPLNKVRSQKVQELQQNNDQLFAELRKANEKYLDVRVENNKMKDQITMLNKNIDQLRAKAGPPQKRASSAVGTAMRKKVSATQRDEPASFGLQPSKQMSAMPPSIH